jgi:cellulose synthase/poly-beta-1,6-N-acetylglucosamine synthase-like glycosyltransferase
MTSIETMLAALFWVSGGMVLYAYFAYPAIVFILSRAFGCKPVPPTISDSELPRVALLIAAHNEEAVIEGRIQNALQLEYPRSLLRIVVASDGSDDGTANVVNRYRGRVTLLDFAIRRGKAATLNDAVGRLDSDIILFSDANTYMERGALKKLAQWFADPSIGVVCGRLELTDPGTGLNVDSVYWRYETFLKRCESRLGALLGANGAIYAMSRSLYHPVADATIVDDFVVPLSARLRSACRMIYDSDAVAFEESAANLPGEFRRRARIGAGDFQAIGMLWRLLDPRAGWIAFTFWSHKIVRWLCPFCLLAAFLTSAALYRHTGYRNLLLAQLCFYAVCFFGSLIPASNLFFKFARLCAMFAGMNLALLIGFVRWLFTKPSGTWIRTARLQGLKHAA